MNGVLFQTEEADAPCSLAALLEANLDTFTHEDVAALGCMLPGDERTFDIGGGVTEGWIHECVESANEIRRAS